jgi:predicted metal-dependent hydrolase
MTALTGPDGQQIRYQLERRARRTVGLKINQQGLVVHAPQRMADAELNRLLLSKWCWKTDRQGWYPARCDTIRSPGRRAWR